MKKTLAFLLLSLVVGCGESHNSQIVKVKATAKVKAAAEANAEAWVSDPNDSNNVKIEAAIRWTIDKSIGELTKADLEKVTNLYLRSNQLTDVTGLEKLTQLTELDLSDNQLTELPKGLDKLTKLTILFIDGDQLTDVTGLEKLTQLTGLHLSNNQLTEVKGLEKLTQLTILELAHNQLTELPEGLEKLTQLTKLNLASNPDLTKAQIDQLKKALPNCGVSH